MSLFERVGIRNGLMASLILRCLDIFRTVSLLQLLFSSKNIFSTYCLGIRYRDRILLI